MELSARLATLYRAKRLFSARLKESIQSMASVGAIEESSVPKDVAGKLKFSLEQMSLATSMMYAFDNAIKECNVVQDEVLEITRFSSYLDQIAPYKSSLKLPSLEKYRSKLNKLRTLFVESLINEDMISHRILSGCRSTFTEIKNFEEFLSYYASYITGYNFDPKSDVSTAVNEYKIFLEETPPGILIELVSVIVPGEAIKGLTQFVEEITTQASKFNVIETDSSVMCWSMLKSYLDLPGRLLKSTTLTVNDVELILQHLKAIASLSIDSRGLPGLNAIVSWSLIARNGLLALINITSVFVELLELTCHCQWEFLFYQLNKLEELEEFEILDSILPMIQQTLSKESLS